MKKEQKKQKKNELNTFPVPFVLGQIKDNITISTNTDSKPSKELILNQALKLHLQGNIKEAANYYQYLIKEGFVDHIVFSNYGIILQSLGNLKEAKIYIRKAIKIYPNFAQGYLNLGSIFNDLGNLKEAEICIRKAIKIEPNYAGAHNNLGLILTRLDKLQEAEIHIRRAIKLQPNNSGNFHTLGNILAKLGNSQEALDSYLKAIKINQTESKIYNSITQLLKDSDLAKFKQSKLTIILTKLLEKDNILHKDLFDVFKLLYKNQLIINLKKLNSNYLKIELVVNNTVIINSMKKIIFEDQELEIVMSKTRRIFCTQIAQPKSKINYFCLQFIIALACQCFLNEYVFPISKEENILLELISERCKKGEINETNISILACYIPLYKLINDIPSLKTFDSPDKSFLDLMKIQISEPIKEIELSKNIRRIGKINDDISKKVQSQYEENPYPRWTYSNYSKNKEISVSKAINNEINPNSVTYENNQKLKVLVAGCGTGIQILQAQRYRNAQVTSIDLSLCSLSYAQRKINELKINNVELIQMDILEISLLRERFDIIECGGVLHHMDNPLKGLEALLDILKPDGFIKLGLYSELARKTIIKARNYISTNKIEGNVDDIRQFRRTVFSGKLPEIASLTSSPDFYTLSSCRDLCFHKQEHTFTLKQLKETLISYELNFLGFLLPRTVKSLYKKYFPEDQIQTNLQNWESFEQKHPNTFSGMYQFWVSKK